jgi:energy-coupling factor transporter ATP-binding protein EcfA2
MAYRVTGYDDEDDDWSDDTNEDQWSELNVPVIPRKDFIREFARNYQPGQHVTFLGPSGRGKTRLAGEMAGAVVQRHPEITIMALHGKIKGRDKTIEQFAKAADLTIGPEHEATFLQRRVTRRKAHGHIVRPLEHPLESPAEENKLLQRKYRKTIHRAYNASPKKPVILLVDEAYQTHVDLKLKTDCEGPLMRGRPVCGEWSLLQRGRFVSMYVYDQAEDVLIFFDPTIDNQRRYGEIGGVDPRVLVRLSRRLKRKRVADGSTISQAIWFHRSSDQLAIVDT